MSTLVRSYSKVNLGLAIGRPRPDGFHELCTLYQTLALHDLVQVSAQAAGTTHIELTCSDTRVPVDARNTAWKMVERALERLGMAAEVTVYIRKSLPVQGGMGAGSANAAAALLGLLRELGVEMPLEDRLAVAAEVGSDVPLFLVGGSVLGEDRGQRVRGVADVRLAGDGLIPCVVALPKVGVSTPLAFREWDQRFEGGGLQSGPICDTLEKLSRTYASVFLNGSPQGQSGNEQDREQQNKGSGATGIFHEPMPAARQAGPEKQQGIPDEQRQAGEGRTGGGAEKDLAENSLLALVQTGIENDFETVVFPQYPLLGEIKRQLMGSVSGEGNALYAALSGSGSALFGLYRSMADAHAAQQRLQQHGVKAIVTSTMPRPLYWSNMFAE